MISLEVCLSPTFTTLGTGVDNAVLRIGTTYEVRGMRETITSYNNATVGSGDIVNQCQFVYNSFGQLTTEYQSHSGAVNTMSTPKVQYGYANGSANTVRPTSLTYPDGRVLTYDYGTTDGIDDASSRIFTLVDDDMSSTHLAEYSYLGRRSFVKVDYTEPGFEYVLFDLAGSNDPDTGDIYSGFDRFGRVKDSRWYDYGSSADADRIKYGYDRNGNRLYRENTVATSISKSFDELYGYDLINRLKDMGRGNLNGSHTDLTTETFAQCWALDETGNWKNFREDDNGDGSWDLIQQRVSNVVNETTNISETVGASWVTPAHSRAGNMTTIPQPSNPTSSYTATYDAWNRLISLRLGGQPLVAEYAYDGARRRVIQKSYVSGVLDEMRHLYYTEPSMWQVIEERVDSATTADKQFVWGRRYVDDVVLRDDSTQRLYGMQDANWNVTSIADDAGDVQERFAYSAYGTPAFLNASFAVQSSSAAHWDTLYCGYQYQSTVTLFHVRTRVLHPNLGLWLQRDLLAYADGLSLYEYVRARPIVSTDPTGRAGAVGCAIGAVGSGLGSLFSGLVNAMKIGGDKSYCVAVTDAVCDAVEGCLTGALGGLISGGGMKQVFKCLGLGALIGAFTSACKAGGRAACDYFFGCPDEFKWKCFWLDVTQGMFDGLTGCYINEKDLEAEKQLLLEVIFGETELLANLALEC